MFRELFGNHLACKSITTIQVRMYSPRIGPSCLHHDSIMITAGATTNFFAKDRLQDVIIQLAVYTKHIEILGEFDIKHALSPSIAIQHAVI